MDSKELLSFLEGYPDVWKVKKDEKPLEALMRFFIALEDSVPESRRPVPTFATVKAALQENKAQLDDLKSKLVALQHQIKIKEQERETINSRVDLLGDLAASKIVVAGEWCKLGLIDDLDHFLIIARLGGRSEEELSKFTEWLLQKKENSGSANAAEKAGDGDSSPTSPTTEENFGECIAPNPTAAEKSVKTPEANGSQV